MRRLRAAEIVAGIGSVVLLASLPMTWFDVEAGNLTVTALDTSGWAGLGWAGLGGLRRCMARAPPFGFPGGGPVILLELARGPVFVAVYGVVALVGWSAGVWVLPQGVAWGPSWTPRV